jgi:hypothetical protein
MDGVAQGPYDPIDVITVTRLHQPVAQDYGRIMISSCKFFGFFSSSSSFSSSSFSSSSFSSSSFFFYFTTTSYPPLFVRTCWGVVNMMNSRSGSSRNKRVTAEGWRR